MASCSDPRSRVWSRPRYSPANAASIGGGGTGQVTSVGSHSSAIPAARHAIRRVHEGSRARSAPRSRQITVAIHPSTPARNTTPPATSARCAFSGSRNSFDLMTRIPRNVRNTVGVSGAPVTAETVKSAWPAIIRTAHRTHDANTIGGRIAGARFARSSSDETMISSAPTCAEAAGRNSSRRAPADPVGCTRYRTASPATRNRIRNCPTFAIGCARKASIVSTRV